MSYIRSSTKRLKKKRKSNPLTLKGGKRRKKRNMESEKLNQQTSPAIEVFVVVGNGTTHSVAIFFLPFQIKKK
jgi:hypothetical protein